MDYLLRHDLDVTTQQRDDLIRAQSRLCALVESYLKQREAPHLSIRADDDQYDDPELWEIADIRAEIAKCKEAAK